MKSSLSARNNRSSSQLDSRLGPVVVQMCSSCNLQTDKKAVSADSKLYCICLRRQTGFGRSQTSPMLSSLTCSNRPEPCRGIELVRAGLAVAHKESVVLCAVKWDVQRLAAAHSSPVASNVGLGTAGASACLILLHHAHASAHQASPVSSRCASIGARCHAAIGW